MLNTEQFNLYIILSIYWQIGSLKSFKNSHADLIDTLKRELKLNSIIECEKFNMKLFLQDYQFLSKYITPQISIEARKKNENCKVLINFCQVKIYGLEDSGEFQRIANFNKALDCNSLLQQIEEQIKTVIKKLKNILIIILSVDMINQQCKEEINNKILSFHHQSIELKYFSITQKQRKQIIKFQQKSSLISEQEWDFLDIEFYKQRYTLQHEGLFLPYKELSENVDEQLFKFECQIHNLNINR